MYCQFTRRSFQPFLCLTYGWELLRQPLARPSCTHPRPTLVSYTKELLYCMFMKPQQLYAVYLLSDMCAAGDLGLAPLYTSTAFKPASAKQKTSSQEMQQPISSCLTFCQQVYPVSMCLIWEQWVGQLGERGCALSRVRADRAVLHVLISIDISHRVFSHASTEVSPIFILSHILLVGCW